MAQPATADVLERCANDLHAAASDWHEPACNHDQVEQRIAEVERICTKARAAVRGRG